MFNNIFNSFSVFNCCRFSRSLSSTILNSRWFWFRNFYEDTFFFNVCFLPVSLLFYYLQWKHCGNNLVAQKLLVLWVVSFCCCVLLCGVRKKQFLCCNKNDCCGKISCVVLWVFCGTISFGLVWSLVGFSRRASLPGSPIDSGQSEKFRSVLYQLQQLILSLLNHDIWMWHIANGGNNFKEISTAPWSCRGSRWWPPSPPPARSGNAGWANPPAGLCSNPVD